ncbi:hypothetical protein Tco_0404918 [Tanacetum coccineum]
MSTSTHPIIVLSNSNVEDDFSSTNTPDYTLALPNYSLASPGNTSSDPSEDLSKDLLASLAISPFHDDLYMKVMQAYNATNDESPIPLPRALIAPLTVLPPSLVLPLSLIFDPRDFFLPEEILPSRKRACSRSPSFTSALPQVFEMEKVLIRRVWSRKQMGYDDEIVLARVRTSALEIHIDDIQISHRSVMKSLLDKIHELKNHKGGPSDY